MKGMELYGYNKPWIEIFQKHYRTQELALF